MPRSSNIPALTGLRALAAFWVVLYHFRELADDKLATFGYLTPLVYQGNLGVDIFFVLSGYIMWHVYADTFAHTVTQRTYREFLLFRIARVYPLHIVTMIVMLLEFHGGAVLFHVTPHHPEYFGAWSVANNLTLTHAWFPGTGAPNGPAWSISAEWFAYLLFPFLVLATRRLRLPYRVALLIAGVLFFAVRPFPSSLETVAVEFLAGMLFCSVSSGIKTKRLASCLSAVAGLVLIAVLYAGPNNTRAILLPVIGLMICGLARETDYGAKVLSWPIMLYLGEISYSLYMCHWAVWSALKRILPIVMHGNTSPLVVIAVGLGGSMLAAAAAYTWIEVPGRRWLRSLNVSPATFIPTWSSPRTAYIAGKTQ